MDLESFGQASGLCGREGFVQARERVRAEVVHDQDNGGDVRKGFIAETAEEVSHIDVGTVIGRLQQAPARQGFDSSEDIRGAAPLVLVVDSRHGSRSCREGHAGMLKQLLACFVEAHLRSSRVVGAMVDFEHVLHGAHERAIVLLGDAEALL